MIQVADALQRAIRQPEDIVARYGGEEFAILLFNATLPEAEAVAARVKQELKLAAISHQASAVSAFVTVSQGLPVLLPQKRLNKLFQMPTPRYTGRKKMGEIDGLYKH